MKKLLVLLTLLVSVFGFSAGAFAQLPTIETCVVPNGRIPCVGGDQALCKSFNFQGQGSTAAGYCTNVKEPGNRAVFIICNCPDSATNFRIGSKIGVRMTILVDGKSGENGAYWAPAVADGIIRLGEYANLLDACESLPTAAYTASFGPGHYYKSSDLTTAGIITPTLAADTVCTIPTGNRATVVVTDRLAGYLITSADEINALSRWAIEIPSIRIDPTILHNGEVISVHIELLNQNVGRGICADCPPICDGFVIVATTCCGVASSSCFYPYFTSTTPADQGQPYWNGIAIVNSSSTAGTATLSVFQKDGAKGTFTTPVIDPGSMFVSALENIDFTASSGTLGGLPVYISVKTTFPTMDGFAMMSDINGQSMGYLCRK